MKSGIKSDALTGQELSREIRVLIQRNSLNLCLECGKCSAVCPMVQFYGEFVPNRCTRNIVERLSLDPRGLADEALWYCLACKECTFYCPSGVDFQNFMMGFRDLVVSRGHREHAHFCAACGGYLMPKRQLDVLKGNLSGTAELLYECPTCKKNRYGATLFKVSPKGKPFPVRRNVR